MTAGTDIPLDIRRTPPRPGRLHVRATPHTGPMRMIDVYPVHAREDTLLEIPVPFIRAGTWHAELRARLVDDAGDWFFEVGYSTGTGENRIDTFPAEWVRRPELTDLDGLVPPSVLERIRGHQEEV